MSQQSFAEFLLALQDDDAMLRRYRHRDLHSLSRLALSEGYDFTAEDILSGVLALEMAVVLLKEAEGGDGIGSLWRDRWGTTYLEYLVDKVAGRFTEIELHRLLVEDGQTA
ncbi:hypothetical protein CFP65_3236 [Kitasatospora sp. MMS16-BH015]|uniref:Nif11-like leader peptide family natural product precursor n=1 Tax=Kitasatospora sp. MMS16-BH015 TaxID=2018025 RepID=UPI000CA165EE|nr:Nif11-like leader peptide family natural product precursor [Kitasatospora sp. MMS16-BH015]AUG78039.1 hypothetical protein CFP65_3236 [Kitasatospora sp. MMS16-BH015]